MDSPLVFYHALKMSWDNMYLEYFFFVHLLAREVLVMKKLEIKKKTRKSTFLISVLNVETKWS